MVKVHLIPIIFITFTKEIAFNKKSM